MGTRAERLRFYVIRLGFVPSVVFLSRIFLICMQISIAHSFDLSTEHQEGRQTGTGTDHVAVLYNQSKSKCESPLIADSDTHRK
ncbi:hypothetical protein B0I35DRAFT_107114 [Stachybotrys elegans]|uniref:Uncharacterized protein n=1 Tax=Stachybotrys elegans TaxID=80388 RepID=A0A8K0SHG9_9HYPO|nr:hypothetical protein B0I35DRAFT_107114 [Stachybotrys elegans]